MRDLRVEHTKRQRGRVRFRVGWSVFGGVETFSAISRKPITFEMTSEAASERRRGRPRVFSDEALRQAARFSYARRVQTRRGAQDLVYRKFAIVAIELYREAFPEKGSPLEWLVSPNPRHSLLSELGRVGEPTSDEHGVLQWNARDVNRLIHAALEIAEAKPTAKRGIAMIRDFRRRYREDAAVSGTMADRLGMRGPPSRR